MLWLGLSLNSGSAEYANLKICILRNELFEDYNVMQLIFSHSLKLFVYTIRCSDDFKTWTRNKTAEVQNMQIQNSFYASI